LLRPCPAIRLLAAITSLLKSGKVEL